MVKREYLVLLGLKEKGVQQGLLVYQEWKGPPDQEEALGKRVHEDLGAGWGLRERKVTLVYLGCLEEMVSQVLKGHKGRKDSEGQLGLLDWKDPVGPLAPLAHLDRLDYQDFLHQ